MIGVIAGLQRELRCLGFGAHGAVTFAAAGCAERAEARAASWIAEGRVRALMSFGLCGALDPRLASGTVVVAHEIALPEGGRLACDGRWANSIAMRISGARVAPLLGTNQVVATTSEKRALFATHAAPVVDMESHGVAAAALRAGIPFVAVRAVADPAERTLPPLASGAIGDDGRVRPSRVLAGLLRRPRDAAALLALAGDARRAYDALVRAAAKALTRELVPQPAIEAPAPIAALPALVS